MGVDANNSKEYDMKKFNRGEDALPSEPGEMEPLDGSATIDQSIDARLDEALEQVAHGATVSVPAILLHKGLAFGFTAVIANVFGASSYGLYALANRLQKFLVALTLSFKSGLNRFLPKATPAEQDALTTFTSLLWLSISALFGIGLFLAAPVIGQLTGHGSQFQLYIRLFAVGLPASVWLFTIVTIYRAFEHVGGYNLLFHIGVPSVHLTVGLVGAFVFRDLVLVIWGVIITMGVIGTIGALWLAWKRGLSPRIRGVPGSRIRSRFVRFSIPLFVNGFAAGIQQFIYYPLIILFLTDIAGGVFAIGVLVGSFVQLPLIGINQFIPPVSAALHDENHREALHQLYQVTSRLVLMGVLGVAIPLILYRTTVMAIFGSGFAQYSPLLIGFILAQVAAGASGSNGILLRMTDHEQAFLAVNLVITAFLIVTSVLMTLHFGLPGLVASYLLMLVVNNGLQVAVLYYLEGIQPFTYLHVKPLLAAIPLLIMGLAARDVFPMPSAAIVGSGLGVTVYIGSIGALGLTRTEHRLVNSLTNRYRETFRTWRKTIRSFGFAGYGHYGIILFSVLIISAGTTQALAVSEIPDHVFGLFAVLSGALLLTFGALD